VLAAVHVMLRDPRTASLPLGLFGASTGAAAALIAAARERHIKAVVSRGGRPDLAGSWLARVQAPTLLIVGGEDRDVLELNREAAEALDCEKQLAVIPRATHLFEEPGTLEEVARLAAEWFARCLHATQLTEA
jgi:putative phosphoribosyl transferase